MAEKRKRTNREGGANLSDAPIEKKDPPRKPNPLELAAPVSAQVQILGVVLTQSVIKSEREIFSEQGQYEVDIRIRRVAHSVDVENQLLLVTPEFYLAANKTTEVERLHSLAIEASFALQYQLASLEGLTEEQFKAFAMTNGIYNAWPYWREYVQSTTSRMGLPPIVVPVFRLS